MLILRLVIAIKDTHLNEECVRIAYRVKGDKKENLLLGQKNEDSLF